MPGYKRGETVPGRFRRGGGGWRGRGGRDMVGAPEVGERRGVPE